MTATSFTCPRCSRTSWNPDDVREGYCGACHDWTGASPLVTAARVLEYLVPVSDACQAGHHSRCRHPSYARRGDGCECTCHREAA